MKRHASGGRESPDIHVRTLPQETKKEPPKDAGHKDHPAAADIHVGHPLGKSQPAAKSFAIRADRNNDGILDASERTAWKNDAQLRKR